MSTDIYKIICDKHPWILNHDLVPWYGQTISNHDISMLYLYCLHEHEYIHNTSIGFPDKQDSFFHRLHPRIKISILNKMKRNCKFSVFTYVENMKEIPEKYLSRKDKQTIKNIILEKLTN